MYIFPHKPHHLNSFVSTCSCHPFVRDLDTNYTRPSTDDFYPYFELPRHSNNDPSNDPITKVVHEEQREMINFRRRFRQSQCHVDINNSSVTLNFYRPHTKYGKGDVFTGVCLFTAGVCFGSGVSMQASLRMQTPPPLIR